MQVGIVLFGLAQSRNGHCCRGAKIAQGFHCFEADVSHTPCQSSSQSRHVMLRGRVCFSQNLGHYKFRYSFKAAPTLGNKQCVQQFRR